MSQKKQPIESSEGWNATSQGYAEKVAPHVMEPFAPAFIERLNLNPQSNVIEVGAGTGALTKALAQYAHSVDAIDYSPQMIAQLEKGTEAAGIHNVNTAVMDGQALSFEANQFNAGASSFAMMLFPDRVKGFSELNRVLKPGSQAVVSGWAGPDKFQAFGLFLQAMQIAFPHRPKPKTPPPIFNLANLVRFKEEMEAGGFQNVTVEYVERVFKTNSFNQLWEVTTAGAPPVQAMFARIGEAGETHLRHTLESIIQERYGKGPIEITNAATFGVGEATLAKI